MASPADLTEAEIVARLAAAAQEYSGDAYAESPYFKQLWPEAPRPAAVLIPLLRCDGEWHVLFTRRTASLAEHSGQVAFPGGRADPDDPDPEATALREAQEEIGLHPRDVRILGHLGEFITITNYQVTPVVGVIPWPYPFEISTEEVSRIFTVPLAWLADPANREERQRALPAPYPPVPVIYFHPFEEEVLWGVSARFTLALLHALDLYALD